MTADAIRAELAANLQDAQRAADEWRRRAETAEADRQAMRTDVLRQADLCAARLDQLERIIRAIWQEDSPTGNLDDADYHELADIIGEGE